MIEVIVATGEQRSPQIRELFWEYLQWANAKLSAEFGVSFDIAAILDDDMNHLGKFMPPDGRLLLVYSDTRLAGISCLKELTSEIGEIKRMYVRPEQRGQGVGRALIERVIREAQKIGYKRLRLDSARFMTDAHRLYRKQGFKEIEAYEGSEIPKEFQRHWIFMEMELSRPLDRESLPH